MIKMLKRHDAPLNDEEFNFSTFSQKVKSNCLQQNVIFSKEKLLARDKYLVSYSISQGWSKQ